MLIVASVLSSAPLLSIAVNVNVSVPLAVPLGSYVSVFTSLGVNTCPMLTGVPFTYSVPIVGKVSIL